MKWTTVAGPRMTKQVNEAIGKLRFEGTTYEEITGTVGDPNDEHHYVVNHLFETPRAAVLQALAQLGAEYNWTITPANYKSIIDAAGAKLALCKSSRPVDDKRITLEAKEQRQTRLANNHAEMDAREQAARASRKVIEAKRPSGAHALIVAELDVNDSDSMTDYFNHKTSRHVAIGWRFSNREDFRQLRAAADMFEPTRHLGLEAPDGIEHRDNYSGGGGNFLKHGSNHDSGWRVRSYEIQSDGTVYLSRLMEDALPEAPPIRFHASEPKPDDWSETAITITENTEKNGIEIRFKDKPDRATIDTLKSRGWRWSPSSKCWYAKQRPDQMVFARRIAGLEV